MPEGSVVHVSVAFTWDRAEGERLAAAWGGYYSSVDVGGPAYGLGSGEFVPGRYIKAGVTFTSRGCNNHCPWCLVPEKEGCLKLIDNFPDGHIIQDNNILQTGHRHLTKVFQMLARQKKPAEFVGGLDARLIDDWVATELKKLRIKSLFLAADNKARLEPLRVALRRLSFLPRDKLRVYTLIGQNESIATALERLETVWNCGGLPFAQLYQPPDHRIEYNREWRQLARTWSRPAATKAFMK